MIEISTQLQQAIGVAVNRAPASTDAAQARQRLVLFMVRLLERNVTVNLVSRKNTQAHLARFLDECSQLAQLLASDQKRLDLDGKPPHLLDIGTGAGFPGLILKVLLPEVEILLLDSTEKKVRFVSEVCEALELQGAMVVWGRAEDMANPKGRMERPEFRHAFDWVTAKAVGPIRQTLGMAVHFLVEGGVHWVFKGATLSTELEASRRLMAQSKTEEYVVKRLASDRESFVLGLRRLPA